MSSEQSTENDQGRVLRIAAMQGDIAKVSALLAEGVSVDSLDDRRWTPLMMAAMYGHSDVVRLLLEYGATIDAQNQFEGTALRYAIERGRAEASAVLLDAGADLAAANRDGKSLLVRAVNYGHSDMVKMFLDRESSLHACATEDNGQTILSLAITRRDEVSIHHLIEHGVDVNARTDYRLPPLMQAAAIGAAGITAQLIAAGADINAFSAEGETALSLAHQYRPVVLDWLEPFKAREIDLSKNMSKLLEYQSAAVKDAEDVIDLLHRAGAKA